MRDGFVRSCDQLPSWICVTEKTLGTRLTKLRCVGLKFFALIPGFLRSLKVLKSLIFDFVFSRP